MTGWVGWEYVGSEPGPDGRLLTYYRCTACRGIVMDTNRARHVKAAHKPRPDRA